MGCGLKDRDRLGGWGGEHNACFSARSIRPKNFWENFWRESRGDGALIHEGPSVSTAVTAIRRLSS